MMLVTRVLHYGVFFHQLLKRITIVEVSRSERDDFRDCTLLRAPAATNYYVIKLLSPDYPTRVHFTMGNRIFLPRLIFPSWKSLDIPNAFYTKLYSIGDLLDHRDDKYKKKPSSQSTWELLDDLSSKTFHITIFGTHTHWQ